MNTTDTIIIGGGQAGLALSHCLTRARPRPPRPRAGPRRRALAQRALGLAAPAHAELDDPPARLVLRRSRPERLHDRAGGRVVLRPATPPRSTRPSCEHTTVQRLAPAGDGFVVDTDDGPFRSAQRRHRHRMVRPAGGPGDGSSTCRPTIHQVVPSRLPTTRTTCRPAACSSSAPRRPACSSPTSCSASGREVTLAVGTPQPHAAPLPGHGHLLVARHDRLVRQDDRRRRRRGRGPDRAVAAARRPARSLHARPRHAAGRRRPPRRSAERRRRRRGLVRRRTSPPSSTPPTTQMARVLGRIDDAIERARPERRGARRRADPVVARRSTRSRRSLDLARRRHQLGRLGDRLSPSLRVAPPADPRPTAARSPVPRRHAGARRLRARPAVPALPQLQLHRRRRPRRALRRRPHLRTAIAQRHAPPATERDHAPEPCQPRTRHRHRAPASSPTTSSSSAPEPPVPPPPCCSPAAACAPLLVDQSAFGADTLSTHALMRGGVLQLAAGACSTRSSPPARRRCGARRSATAASDVVISIKPSHGVDALYAPRRTVLDPVLVARRDRRRRRACYDRTSVTDLISHRRTASSACGPRTADGAPSSSPRRS